MYDFYTVEELADGDGGEMSASSDSSAIPVIQAFLLSFKHPVFKRGRCPEGQA